MPFALGFGRRFHDEGVAIEPREFVGQRHELLIEGADPNLVQVWHVSHRSGAAAGRVADHPLQPVVRRPCVLGAVGRHVWPSPTLRIQRIRFPEPASQPLRTAVPPGRAGPAR